MNEPCDHEFRLLTDELGIEAYQCLKCKYVEWRGEVREDEQHPDGEQRFFSLLDKAVKHDKD